MLKQDNKKQISKAEVQRSIEAGIKEHDVFRMQGMQGLSAFRGKKDVLYARESQRLAKKHGHQDARVQTVMSNQKANADFVQGLSMEITRTTVESPVINERSWLVHGHVYDRAGCPLGGAEVALYRLDGQPVTEIPAVKTNNKGYYKLGYETSTDNIKRAQEASAAASTVERDDTKSTTGLHINRAVDNRDNRVFVRVMAAGNSEICAGSTPIEPKLGQVNYRDVILDISDDQSVPGKDRRTGRYLGNSSTRELHDLKNEQPGCRIDAIRFDHCVAFKSQKQAIDAGYDYCAYCFGKDKSKR